MKKKRYRCIFLGYLWKLARVIHNSNFVDLLAVGIEPQRKASSDAISYCNRYGLPWFDARNIRENTQFRQYLLSGVDFIVVGAFGQILDRNILESPRYGVLNIHPSLLPAYRGGSPIEQQIIAGERKGGVTLHWLAEEIDAGPIVTAKEVIIRQNDDYQMVLDRSIKAAEKLMRSLLGKPIESWPRVKYQVSKPLQALRTSDDCVIDWSQDAVSINRLVLAEGWKGCVRTELKGGNLVIFKAKAENPLGLKKVSPGTVLEVVPSPLIATGKGTLRLLKWDVALGIRRGQVLPSSMKKIKGSV
ncbi:MAG: formyltransferase family protein [Candidatus Omnitrophica bacterium]|nr:formyltransferase family protein [Candidatus Omnitrophota bacterium]